MYGSSQLHTRVYVGDSVALWWRGGDSGLLCPDWSLSYLQTLAHHYDA